MNKIEMLEAALKEVEHRAMLIKAMGAPEEINCEYHKASGYIRALQEMEIFDDEQFNSALDVLNAALREAAKKTALPLTQENGSKEGCPNKDDSLTHAFSLDDKSKDVKPLAFMTISYSEFHVASTEIHGSALNLATCLARLISCLSMTGVDRRFIYAGITAGFQDAHLPLEDLKC